MAGSPQSSYTYDRSSNHTSKTEGGSTFLFTFDVTDVLATQKMGTGAAEAFIYDPAMPMPTRPRSSIRAAMASTAAGVPRSGMSRYGAGRERMSFRQHPAPSTGPPLWIGLDTRTGRSPVAIPRMSKT